MSLTLFCTTKAFVGSVGVAQRNALGSWQRLAEKHAVEILIIGNEEGASEAASTYGARCIPKVATSDSGAPLLDSLFNIARVHARHETLAYLNADILLFDDFENAIRLIESRSFIESHPSFLLTSRRYDAIVGQAIRFDDPGWAATLPFTFRDADALDAETALDLFVFSRDLYRDIPRFSVGRTAWDNWLIAEASHKGAAIVDATPAITLLHQAHDYNHLPGKWLEAWNGTDATRNRELAGNDLTTLTLAATHSLDPNRGLQVGPSKIPSHLNSGRSKLALAEQALACGEGERAWHMALEALALDGELIYYSPELARSDALSDIKRTLLDNTLRLGELEILKHRARAAVALWLRSRLEQGARPLYIWGAGSYGRSLARLLREIGLAPELALDKDAARHGSRLDGISISGPDTLAATQIARPFVVIATMYRESVRNALSSKGFAPIEDFI